MGSISMRENAVRNTDLYLYLSKKLLENFGFRNPKFELITKNFTASELDEMGSGLAYMQEYYKSKGLQRTTDKEVSDYINKCKGIS
jgi:nitrate reductase assembly molybdenum cofactor insertion protein NarJ